MNMIRFDELRQENERLEETNKQIIKTADVIDERNQTLIGQVEEMKKIIATAVMFLQSNDLYVKAEQIKGMVIDLERREKK
jgi:hypothetical protein